MLKPFLFLNMYGNKVLFTLSRIVVFMLFFLFFFVSHFLAEQLK